MTGEAILVLLQIGARLWLLASLKDVAVFFRRTASLAVVTPYRAAAITTELGCTSGTYVSERLLSTVEPH